ncbi:hypothetical protein XELAEV_18031700mg [Xenopus laevis]|uniref:Uncharacterized protein n=1 Tax=Xenopus laevis TaxID=8355 RepID=A0A974CP96_XENLA|nr:hypothetical protein XELAEV_18031700mg [Xenopus laevis]
MCALLSRTHTHTGSLHYPMGKAITAVSLLLIRVKTLYYSQLLCKAGLTLHEIHTVALIKNICAYGALLLGTTLDHFCKPKNKTNVSYLRLLLSGRIKSRKGKNKPVVCSSARLIYICEPRKGSVQKCFYTYMHSTCPLRSA